jgi:hypothetical protein
VKKRIKVPKNWEDPPESFERFKALAKGLMSVPKKELDKELAKHERKRETKSKKRT